MFTIIFVIVSFGVVLCMASLATYFQGKLKDEDE